MCLSKPFTLLFTEAVTLLLFLHNVIGLCNLIELHNCKTKHSWHEEAWGKNKELLAGVQLAGDSRGGPGRSMERCSTSRGPAACPGHPQSARLTETEDVSLHGESVKTASTVLCQRVHHDKFGQWGVRYVKIKLLESYSVKITA